MWFFCIFIYKCLQKISCPGPVLYPLSLFYPHLWVHQCVFCILTFYQRLSNDEASCRENIFKAFSKSCGKLFNTFFSSFCRTAEINQSKAIVAKLLAATYLHHSIGKEDRIVYQLKFTIGEIHNYQYLQLTMSVTEFWWIPWVVKLKCFNNVSNNSKNNEKWLHSKQSPSFICLLKIGLTSLFDTYDRIIGFFNKFFSVLKCDRSVSPFTKEDYPCRDDVIQFDLSTCKPTWSDNVDFFFTLTKVSFNFTRCS